MNVPAAAGFARQGEEGPEGRERARGLGQGKAEEEGASRGSRKGCCKAAREQPAPPRVFGGQKLGKGGGLTPAFGDQGHQGLQSLPKPLALRSRARYGEKGGACWAVFSCPSPKSTPGPSGPP